MNAKRLMATGAVALAILSAGGAAIAAGKSSQGTPRPTTQKVNVGDSEALDERGQELPDSDDAKEAKDANERAEGNEAN